MSRKADCDEDSMRERFARTLEAGEQHAYERDVTIGTKPHTLLDTDKPVRIGNESLLLSTTLDITELRCA